MDVTEFPELSRDQVGALRCHDINSVESVANADEGVLGEVLNIGTHRASEIRQRAMGALQDDNPFSTNHTTNMVTGFRPAEVSSTGWCVTSHDKHEIVWSTEHDVFTVTLRASSSGFQVSTTVPREPGGRDADYIMRNLGSRNLFFEDELADVSGPLTSWFSRHSLSDTNELYSIDTIGAVRAQYLDIQHDISTIEGLYTYSTEHPREFVSVFRSDCWTIRNQLAKSIPN